MESEHRFHNRDSTTLLDPARGGEQNVLKSLRCREDGQTMAEYGVLLAVMTLAVVASMMVLGDNMRAAFEFVAGLLPG